MDWTLEREIIYPGSEADHRAVRRAQRLLRQPVTGEMDSLTRAALRGFQRLVALEPTGTLTPQTAGLLAKLGQPHEEDECPT